MVDFHLLKLAIDETEIHFELVLEPVVVLLGLLDERGAFDPVLYGNVALTH